MKYNQSKLTAINLSWGGATIDDTLLVPFMDVIEGLNRQVAGHWSNKYAGGGSDSANFHWQSHDTLITFWFGINDIIRAFHWENRTEVWNRDLKTYRESIVSLDIASLVCEMTFLDCMSLHSYRSRCTREVAATFYSLMYRRSNGLQSPSP